MAEVFVELMQSLTDADGEAYGVIACGDPNEDGTWHGWLEFVPAHGDGTLRTPRETTQPGREHVVYWATGLTPVYLEGAFARAQAAAKTPAGSRRRPVRPVASGEAILDPFSVYQKGVALLRRQLGALEPWHLVNIIVAYELSPEVPTALAALPRAALVELIVDRVAAQTHPSRPPRHPDGRSAA